LVRRQAWLRFLPYLVSLCLAFWGLAEIYNYEDPWAYIIPWRYSYLYIAAGILAFLVLTLYRLRTDLSPVSRQQARIILWGSLLSFTPLIVWIGAPFFGMIIPWNSGFFLPLLMFFPLSIGFAILRYRLWDIDVIVNRTLVYSALTVLLALIYVASVLLFEQLFRPFTRNNQLAAVVSTLAIAALFNPLRRRVQEFIDIRFYRRKYDMAKTLSTFGATLRDEVDLNRLTDRLEEVIRETMQPSSVSTWLSTPTGYRVLSNGSHAHAGDEQKPEIPLDDPFIPTLRFASSALDLERLEFDSPARQRLSSAGVEIILPLISQGELVGWLSLGRRLSQRDYSADDLALLTNLTSQAAPAVRVAQLVNKEQAQAVERERFENELELARRIQLALLPKELPTLDQWAVAAHYQPARAVGGDFYDFIPFEDGRLGIVIGDVTGKGVPAALVMATTRSIMRAIALQGLSPGEVLRLVNNQLELDIPDLMFVTCLDAILETSTGSLCYANAGHNLPYCRSSQGLEELRALGMPLGLMSNMDYEEKEISLNPGDFLLLYSDGLIEAHNSERKMFGSQRLRSLVNRAVGNEMSLIHNLLVELAEFTGESWDQEDDITLVMLHRSI
jgi:serine phosphatase RsbU (regulator of sigma subunit)